MLALMEQRTEKYIMCVDSMDVVSAEMDGISGVRETKRKLHEMCNAAGGYHPQLNIGAWIGEREYALHCFKEAERIERYRPEDPTYNYDVLPQWLMQMKVSGDGPEFALDWKCELFQSMNKADVTMEGKRARNNVTGTRPVLLHYNGDKTYGAYHEMVRQILLEKK